MADQHKAKDSANYTGRPPRDARLAREKAELKDVKGTLKRLVGYLLKKRSALALVTVCSVVTTAIAVAGTRLNGYVIDVSIASRDIAGLLVVCVILAGMHVFGMGFTYAQNLVMIRVAHSSCADIRRDLFGHLQKLPMKYFDTHSSGDLMSRLTNDVDNINETMSTSVLQFLSGILSIVGQLAAMLILSPLLTLIALLTTCMSLLMTKFVARISQRFFVAQQRDLGSMNGYMEEMISGQKVIKLFSREKASEAAMGDINNKYIRSAFKAQAVSGMIGPGSNMISNIGYLLVAAVGGVFVISHISGLTVGGLFSYILYMRGFYRPMSDIMSIFNTVQLALAGAERVFEVMDEAPETDRLGAIPIEGIEGEIRLKDVNFSYIEGKPVLRDSDIAARPGETVAIVGPTGAGKTTIINLITRFYDVDSGQISIDGMDIKAIERASLRRAISIVSQDTFLFSDTIRENIRYGRAAATDEEVEQAARQACAHDFILQMPEGYNFVLSDNGANLSQGQRQLLSIARAIISKASVLILDEATSCVDTRTELQIQNALLRLMKGKTCFVIAHRLSTIRNADKILVVADGRVIEQGTHLELLRAEGHYADLYNSQFKTGMVV